MNARRVSLVLLLVLASVVAAGAAAAANARAESPAVSALKAAIPDARVSLDAATGNARFVRLPEGREVSRMRAGTEADKVSAVTSFLSSHGAAFGLRSAARDLTLRGTYADRQGATHLEFAQQYAGVPVFGAFFKAHFDAGDRLSVLNGRILSDIRVAPTPSRDAAEAARAALDLVGGADSKALQPRLLIYREGFLKGAPGADHLVWEVEVGNGADVREFVYVDAHNGKVVDRISGIQDAMFRRAYNAMGLTAPGPNYPATPYWVEGDLFPTASTEANNMILASGEIYDVFDNAFGRDAFDGAGAIMDSIFNRGNGCPNASWNGLFISFCPGTTSDDVTAHEWGHAYTQYTHDLIYQWQSGALNESYSDIWGETVDLGNGRQTDAPGGLRTAGNCSAFTSFPPILRVNSPAVIAGTYPAGPAQFGPPLSAPGLTGNVVLANDGVGASMTDGCCAGPSFVCAPGSWPNAAAIAGNIAMVDRGTCGFAIKVKNAQNQGATGVIVGNNVAGTLTMAGSDPSIVISSLIISLANANLVKGQLPVPGVNATLTVNAPPVTDNSYRWLIGEDATAFGGAIRDMWNPTCYGNPGKVSDAQYTCSTGDGGGVHSNSGVPNHSYALIVDGGTYNGETVSGIGVTKAAHIYYRAQSVYQGPASDFADHADAIEQSCADLIGEDLADLSDGLPSGEVITASDCDQVAAAAAAVELRTPPTQCNFQPLLAQDPPALCPAGSSAKQMFRTNAESGDSAAHRWAVSHDAVFPADFTPRDWEVSGDLPDDRAGRAFFGIDPTYGTCAPGGDESGVLHLTSPKISLPATATLPRLAFDHWVATEPGYDGGNIKISVNGGPWTLVAPGDFVYNAYNTTLFVAGNTNPMAGEPAFSGTDGGSVDGSWGRSIVNLAPYALPQDKIRLRFDLGTDGCGGAFGWYVDDLIVYRCQ